MNFEENRTDNCLKTLHDYINEFSSKKITNPSKLKIYIEKIYNISPLRIKQTYKKQFKYSRMNIINIVSIILS